MGGHPDSELWGDAGLIAATMWQRGRLAEALRKATGIQETMNTDTPRTNESLVAILERDGELSEKNVPEALVKLCRAMECKVEELNHQLARSQEDDDLLVIAWMHGARFSSDNETSPSVDATEKPMP